MTPLLEVKDLTVKFTYGISRVTALNDVSLNVDEGEFVTVIGSNGAGKSTLINSIAGSIQTTTGKVTIKGRNVTRLPDYRRAKFIARVFQGTTVGICPEISVAENMMLAFARGRRRSIIRPALRRARVQQAETMLRSYGVGLEERLKRPAALLSGGQQQLLALVMACATRPDVLLLDEHTSALDPKMAELVMETTEKLVRESRLTTIMVTHNMRHAAKYGDRVLIMDRGVISGDLAGDDRRGLDENTLIARFRALTGGGMSDRMLG